MKKVLSFAVAVAFSVVAAFAQITSVPTTQGFEDGIGEWSYLSKNTANQSRFGISVAPEAGGSASTNAGRVDPYNGTHYFRFMALEYCAPSKAHQYLYSPELQLPAGSSYAVKIVYRAYRATDPETFSLLASTTTAAESAFTDTIATLTVNNIEWDSAIFALPEGATYFAIDYSSQNAAYLFVDDISIIANNEVPTVTISGPATAVAGTNVTFTATSTLASSFAWTVDGTAQNTNGHTLTTSFATTGDHTVSVVASNANGNSEPASATINITTAPATISGPVAAQVGEQATYTATCEGATAFAWTVNGAAQSSTTNTMTYTFATGGVYTIAVAATTPAGVSNASMTTSVESCDAVMAPYSQNFETEEGMACWKIIDNGGDGFTWNRQFCGLRDEDDDYYGHGNSQGLMTSWSWSYTYDVLTGLDNWLISPAITLPASGDFSAYWYARGLNSEDYAENYSVYISTTGNNVSDFNTVLYTGTPDGYDWSYYHVSLANYLGQTVYIAFRHYGMEDEQMALGIDDFSVREPDPNLDPEVGISALDAASISVYPNPATSKLNIAGEGIRKVEILDIDGRVMAEYANAGQMDVSRLANGIYMVRVIADNGTCVKKFVKE